MDDHPVVRHGLCIVLAAGAAIEVVGEATNGLEAVEMVGRLKPQVVVMDLRLPRLDGLQAIRRTKTTHPDMGVIVLTMCEDAGLFADAMEAGAEAYLTKDAPQDLLLHAVRTASSSGSQVQNGLPRGSFAAGTAHRSSAPWGPRLQEHLAPRELEVLRLVGGRLTSKEIAKRLRIRDGTAKRHVQSTIGQLQAQNRAQAGLLGVRYPGEGGGLHL